MSEAWQNPTLSQGDVVERLETVAKTLAAWSQRKFSHAFCQIEALKSRLVEMTNGGSGEHSKEETQSILGKIENHWKQE